MTFDYAKTAASAERMLKKYGAAGTISRAGAEGSPDPLTGVPQPSFETVQDIVGVVFPIDSKLVDGTTVLATDETAYISTVGVWKPRSTDVLAINDQTYTVMDVKWLAPAGVAVLGELIVRA